MPDNSPMLFAPDPPPQWRAWIRLPGRRWKQGPGAATWAGAWAVLLDRLEEIGAPHAEGCVLAAGRHPNAPAPAARRG